MLVKVRGDNIDGAIKTLKRKMQKEGLFRDMRRKEAYEKPSDRKRRRHEDAIKRRLRQSRGAEES
jgi:small subunit ribosomal protein S21